MKIIYLSVGISTKYPIHILYKLRFVNGLQLLFNPSANMITISADVFLITNQIVSFLVEHLHFEISTQYIWVKFQLHPGY
jgi:hypothetical protein